MEKGKNYTVWLVDDPSIPYHCEFLGEYFGFFGFRKLDDQLEFWLRGDAFHEIQGLLYE